MNQLHFGSYEAPPHMGGTLNSSSDILEGIMNKLIKNYSS